MQNSLAALPIFILTALILTGFGRLILSALRLKADSALEKSLFGAGLGFGAFAYVVLGIGVCHLLYPKVLAGLLIVIAILSWREIAGLAADIGRGLRFRREGRVRISSAAITVSLILLGTLALIRSLAPPSEMDWDALAYHLAVPKMYLAHHGIFYIPFMSHSNFPFLIEMLYTLGLAFGSIGAAKLFHFSAYGLSAVAVYSLARRHLNPTIGAVGALIFASVPVVIWEAGNAYSDIATALYITLAVYAVLNWKQTKAAPWLVVAGTMCGFALGTKVLSLVPIGVLCIWVLCVSRGMRGGLKASFLVGGLAVLIGLPWYIKSYIYTGNPVYPFLYNIFGGRCWSQSAADAYRNAQLAFGMGRGLREFLMLPWNLTVNGTYFFDQPNPNAPKLFGLIGPAFLGLIPLQVLLGRRSSTLSKIGLVCAAYVIAWFFLMQQARYLIGILPLLAIVAAAGLDAARSMTRWVATGFLAVCVLLGLATGYGIARPCVSAALGIEPPDQYLSRTLDAYDAQEYANEFLPTGAKIVMFDEVRGFYLNREYIWGNPGHSEMIPWRTFRTGEDMVRYFEEQGFTHALVNWRLAKYSGNDLLHGRLIPEAISRGGMREVYGAQMVGVYELGRANAGD